MNHRFLRALAYPALTLAIAGVIGRPAVAAKSVTLANGLQVIAEERRVSSLVAVSVLYRVGSRDEVAGHTGVSHFVEHMLFNGTQKYPGDKSGKEILRNGGVPIGETWWDYTHFGAIVPSDKIDLVLDVEADRMANAVVDSQAVEDERGVIQEELSMRGEAPLYVLLDDVFATAFKVHPYHHFLPGGYFGDVSALAPSDVEAFYHEHYNPANTVITIVGNVGEDEAIEKVRQYFEPIPAGTLAPTRMPQEPEQLGLRRITVRGTAAESRILVFFKGPAYATRDYEVVNVLATLLGNGRSSLLGRRLVDTDVASDASAVVFPTIDPFGLLLMVSVAKGGDVKTCERAIYEAIEGLKTGPVAEDATTKARSRTQGLAVLERETVKARAFELGTAAVRGDWKYADTFVDDLGSVSSEEMLQVARTYLDWNKATIGWLLPKGSGPTNDELIGDAGPHSAGSDFGIASGPAGGAPGDLPASLAPVCWIASDASATAGGGGSSGGGGSPAGGGALRLSDAEYDVLSNGVTLILKEDHSLPIVAVRASVAAGSAYEPDGKSGAARLAVKTAAMGSTRYPYRTLYDTIEAFGSDLAVESDLERASISTSVVSAHADEACRMICDLLVAPTFGGDDFKRARSDVLSQVSKVDEDAGRAALRKFHEVYFAGHPYSRPAEGSEESVKRMSLKDVKGYYASAWRPERTIVTVVGDFDAGALKPVLSGILGAWKATGAAPGDVRAFEPAGGFTQHVETDPEKLQAKIYWGMRGPSLAGPDMDRFQVMNFIFGGQAFGSRLFDRIREKEALAYVVSTDLDLTKQPGAFYIHLGTRPKNVKTAIEAAREEMTRFATDGATAEEMDLAKNFLRSILPFQLQTYSGIATSLNNLRFFGLPKDHLDTYGQRIDAVTSDDVLEAARTYLKPENSCLVILGPVDDNLQPVAPSFKRSGDK